MSTAGHTSAKDAEGRSAGTAAGTDESLRFGFGRNWAEFVARHFDEARVEASRLHLLAVLRRASLEGLDVLDVGCGSGLHSLAALRAGAARVVGFDVDPDSVATSLKVREMAAAGDPRWTAEQGSVLDAARMRALPAFDLVYSWGVLHHTGDLWTAMDNVVLPLKPGGVAYLALYSADQYVDPPAADWVRIKRAYNGRGPLGRRLMEWKHAARIFRDGLLQRLEPPWSVVRGYGTRGMDFWTDVRDWLGGWPIEFASYAEVERWSARHGLAVVYAVLGEGCTEYLVADTARNAQWGGEESRRRAALEPLRGPFEKGRGRSWVARLPELRGKGDDARPPRGSTLMLYDRGRPLGLAHFTHDHVARFGGGRFSHWDDYLLFSTPDGTDPNAEPARWSFCADY